MREWVRIAILLPCLATLGCTTYVMNGDRHYTNQAALKMQAELVAKQLSGIQKLGYVGGSLLVVVPGDDTLTAPPFVSRTLARGSKPYEFFVEFWKRDFAAVAQAIAQAEFLDATAVTQAQIDESGALQRGFDFLLTNAGYSWQLKDLKTGEARDIGVGDLKSVAERVQDHARAMKTARASVDVQRETPR